MTTPYRKWADMLSLALLGILAQRLHRASRLYSGALAEAAVMPPAGAADELSEMERALRNGLFELAHPGVHAG
jgi:hypothetical protein